MDEATAVVGASLLVRSKAAGRKSEKGGREGGRERAIVATWRGGREGRA